MLKRKTIFYPSATPNRHHLETNDSPVGVASNPIVFECKPRSRHSSSSSDSSSSSYYSSSSDSSVPPVSAPGNIDVHYPSSPDSSPASPVRHRSDPPPPPTDNIDLDSSSSSNSSYDSNGHREPPPDKFAEDTIEQSVYEVPDQPHYVILKEGTNQGKLALTDQLGFSYSLKDKSKKTFTWRCVHRPSYAPPCNAKVKQRITEGVDFAEIYDQADFTFVPPSFSDPHYHIAKDGIHKQKEVMRDAKKAAMEEKFKASRQIVMAEL